MVKPSSCGADFFLFGDAGEASSSLTTLRDAIQKDIEENYQPEAIVLLGDNFYPNGVASVEDSRFDKCFENIFVQEDFKCNFQVVLGNHDHCGNIQAQIDYTQISDRWDLPNLWYSKHYLIDNEESSSASSVLMVYIDTWYFDLEQTNDMLDYGKRMGYNSDSVKTATSVKFHNIRAKQLEWLENTLATSKSDYLIVCGHYPVYSDSFHGTSDELINLLVPLFKKYQVDAYFNGHDHVLQVAEREGIPYVTVGLSAVNAGNFSGDEPDMQLKSREVGYASLSIQPEYMDINIVAAKDRTSLYSRRILKKNRRLDRYLHTSRSNYSVDRSLM
mmetsp:Transcript_4049/g.4964  ORF Transcript_4049/g.4964 Transcript_4049/m.4964 type:complete len:331 (+) Transcript_4049:409-1401(+)